MFRPPTGHVSPHTLRDTAAQRLRDDIVTGALRPNEILKDVDLALRLDISTTPVREALSQLALERLIIMPANRPKRVAPLSKRYALEMYAVFRLLAADAYRRGSPELGPEAVAAIAARTKRSARRSRPATGERRSRRPAVSTTGSSKRPATARCVARARAASSGWSAHFIAPTM
jgi:DNA-binding GntR family transcriptional regulator